MTEFNKIPEYTRTRLAKADYKEAERKCPQKMAIGKLMKEAEQELS